MESYGDGSYISSFCSLGPKAYHFQVKNKYGKVVGEVTKLKGIHFYDQTTKLLSGQTIEKLVENPGLLVFAPQYNIQRKLFKKTILSTSLVKNVQFMSRKRMIPADNNPLMKSFPFGYVEP